MNEKENNSNKIEDKSSNIMINNQSKVITTLMSNTLVKKPKNMDDIFKSERINNDEDIETIETKLNDFKNTNDVFSRENIISNRDFNIPEKKIKDELIILDQDRKSREIKIKEFEKELKTEEELHKKCMEKDDKKLKEYYRPRRRSNAQGTVNFILVIILIILLGILILLIILLEQKG